LKIYDTIVIGAGPAGMTAALYLARTNLCVLLLEQGAPGGQMNNTAKVENYPGFASITGYELARKMFEPLSNLGVENRYGIVQELQNDEKQKIVICEDQEYRAKTVVIATGATHRHLNIPSEDEYAGRGVSYCAVCDGPFFRDKDLVVVGGGDSAVEEALFLTNFAQRVNIVHRRSVFRAQKIIQERAFANEKIVFIRDCVVEKIKGNEQVVTAVQLKNVKTGVRRNLACGGVFIYVGLDPMSKPFLNLGITDKDGWIETDPEMKTVLPGIFSVGDVRRKTFRQITTAVGEGGISAQQVYLYLQKLAEQQS